MKFLKIAKKFVTNFLMGLKIWDEVGVGGPLFSKLQQVGDFSYFLTKSMISELRGRVPADVCHQEPSFSLRGPAKAPKQRSAEGASCLLIFSRVKLIGVVNIQTLTLGDQQVFFINSAPWKIYIFFNRRTVVPGPLNFFVLYIHHIWDVFFGGLVLWNGFFWCIVHLKKRNEINNLCFFIQGPKKRTIFGVLCVQFRPSSV